MKVWELIAILADCKSGAEVSVCLPGMTARPILTVDTESLSDEIFIEGCCYKTTKEQDNSDCCPL